MHRGWDHAVDHQRIAGFLCERQCIPHRDRIPMHIFPDPEPVERWFNEGKSDVTLAPGPFDDWLGRYRP